MNQQKLFEEKMSREELAQYLWKAADVLRGPIEVWSEPMKLDSSG